MQRTTKPANTENSQEKPEKEAKNTEMQQGHKGVGKMARVCQICCHSKRLEIDRKLVNHPNCSEISRKYRISYNALLNHRDNHLSRQLMKSAEIRELTMAETVAKDVSSIYSRLNTLLDRAEKKNYTRTFVEIAKEIRAYSEFLLRLQATFERIAQEEASRPKPSDEAVVIDVGGLDDHTLNRLMRLLAESRVEGGKPIPAAPVRDTLH